MNRQNTVLVAIDLQEKLLPVVQQSDRVLWNTRRLLEGAKILDVPALASEQYPKGLGGTHSAIATYFTTIPEKLEFSAAGCLADQLEAASANKVLLAGIETHVCVQQTALDLLAAGYDVLVAVDAVSSRYAQDTEIALRRMESSGITLTTTEAVLFEWCQVAGTPQFKAISQLVREPAPTS